MTYIGPVALLWLHVTLVMPAGIRLSLSVLENALQKKITHFLKFKNKANHKREIRI